MMRQLMNKVGEIGQDNLIAKIHPRAGVTGVTIRALAEETELARGTVMALSSADHKLVVLGSAVASESETLTPAYILCGNVVVGTEDVGAVAYRTGCFNTDAVTVAEGYTMTEADRDALRKYGIVFFDNMQK